MVYECKRRRGAGHFSDARGDMVVVHVTRGKERGRALLVVWGGGNLPADDGSGKQPEHDGRDFASLRKSEGVTELLLVIRRGI